MTIFPAKHRAFLVWTMLLVVAAGGCAQFPRIDPTGESLFLGPGVAPAPAIVGGQTFAAPVASLAPSPLSGALVPPPATAIPPGNIISPPIFSTPTPPPAPPGQFFNPFATTQVISPPVSSATGQAVPVGPLTPVPTLGAAPGVQIAPAGPPGEHVTMSPQRIMAPVGSEVILKAGVCASTGYMLANQRVEWMLSRDGVGQFVTLNNRGELDLFRWPWNTPRKVDNFYAIGATSTGPRCLDRGTPDPSDNVQILRGEAWISVTSPTEGTSHVTAYSPILVPGPGQRAVATIHWIDAQWVFPPSVSVEAGRDHTLTTVVTRRSDGAPLAGYIVRYDVGGGGARLGYDEGGSTNVPTDAQGRASVTVQPNDASGGTAVVNIAVIRPANVGTGTSPELALGQGSATLTWGAGGAATAPPRLEPTPSPPPLTPLPSNPPPFTPPADEPPPGRSDLTVKIRNTGAEQLQVGEFASFDVTITNNGDGTARSVKVTDRYDVGLSVPGRTSQAVEQNIGDLAPGQTHSLPLSFEVTKAGRLCHDVTASAASGSPGFEQACITATEPPPVVQAVLDVTMEAPLVMEVGETRLFRIVVRNVGQVAATNVVVENQYPQALAPVQAAPGHEHLTGRLVWNIDRLEVGERREYKLEFRASAADQSACNLAKVSADGPLFYADEKCTEIQPARGTASPPGATQPGATLPPLSGPTPVRPAAPAQPQVLQLSVTESAARPSVNSQMLANVLIANTSATSVYDVSLRIAVPPELAAQQIPGQLPSQYRLEGNQIVFDPIAEVRAGEQIRITVPVRVNRTGQVKIWARLNGPSIPQAIEASTSIIDIGSPTL